MRTETRTWRAWAPGSRPNTSPCRSGCERAFEHQSQPPRTFTTSEIDELRREGKGRYILHVFGDPRREKDVVLGPGDLLRLLGDGTFRGLATELYQKRSFLFMGFDPGDP